METIAVYWESRIRTYGFNLFEDVGLHRIDLRAEDLATWASLLQASAEDEAGFRLVWCQRDTQGPITFFLVCHDSPWAGPSSPGNETPALPATRTPADVICFQGPHFGDRYGIMDFTYQALAEAEVPLLGVVCSVASIYLVMPAGWGGKAQTLLKAAFEIPKSVRE